MIRISLCLAGFMLAGSTLAAESAQQAFVRAWMGRPVIVKSTLYSLVFNERGRLGNMRSGVREGLIVATPSAGSHFQFDGRQGRDTVIERDLQRIVSAVSTAYERDALEVRSYRKIEPIAINRFDPGVELVVSGVDVNRDQLKLDLALPGDKTSTSIRIKWPAPLSKGFTERPLLEDLIRRFVDLKPLNALAVPVQP